MPKVSMQYITSYPSIYENRVDEYVLTSYPISVTDNPIVDSIISWVSDATYTVPELNSLIALTKSLGPEVISPKKTIPEVEKEIKVVIDQPRKLKIRDSE